MADSAFRPWDEERGQGLVEYALIFTLISLVAVISMGSVATSVSHAYSEATHKITKAHSLASKGGDHFRGTQGRDSSQSSWGASNTMKNKLKNNFAGGGHP